MRILSRTALSAILVGSLLAAAPTATAQTLPPGGTFWDDNGNTHEGFIEAIAAIGVTQGCDTASSRYCPDDLVTREQMATFLARALGLDPVTANRFTDVSGVHAPNVNAVAEAGITLGCNADGTEFCPTDPVRRDQMASFLARAFGDLDPATVDYFSDDTGNTHEANINIVAENGITLGCDAAGTLYCPSDRVPRDQMASFLGRALGLTEIEVPPASDPQAELVVSGLGGPLLVISPPGDDRLFVPAKNGVITVIDASGTALSTPFLNISSLVSGGGEQGLLGMAFHREYAVNGLFYLYYTDTSNNTQVSSYQVSSDPNIADPNTASPVLDVNQPFTNHNGGHIEFGPDGYLYIGLGDGGGGGDPRNHGEDPTTWLGSILRIDVDGDHYPATASRNYAIPADNPFVGSSAGADEVWAYGVRNPWRFSFDDGYLYMGDVGQDRWEEINVSDASVGGLNFGWDRLEGAHCFDPPTGCSSAGTVLPVVEHAHGVAVSITGGRVYRGSAMPDLVGTYFYGDAGARWIKSFRYVDGAAVDQRDWPDLSLAGVWSFGVDNDGEMYFTTSTSVYKIVP